MLNLMVSEFNCVFVFFDLYLGIESMLISVLLLFSWWNYKRGWKEEVKGRYVCWYIGYV